MITLLQDYIAINTAHPNPDYFAAIGLFKKHALADGFLVNEVILPSGNPVLVITLQGRSSQLPALALNHHMDVVAAENIEEWMFNPFTGTIHNDVIYGRGTQDCKGLGVAHYSALKRLKQTGLQPERTIHCVIIPDEERGGFFGTKEFIQHSIFESLNIGYVLDEGMPSGNDQELLIKVDERTPIQIQVTSSGKQSHASGLFHENCIHTLINFLGEVQAFQVKQRSIISEQPGNLISVQITSLTTNNHALNVIPSQVHATLDMRLPSHVSHEDGIAIMDALIKRNPSITYKILATSKERFKTIASDSYFYQRAAKAVTQYGLSPKPFAFEATTDARFYSHKGIEAIGLTPFSVKPNLHGTNEHIRIKDLEQGTAIIYNFLHAFCMINN